MTKKILGSLILGVALLVGGFAFASNGNLNGRTLQIQDGREISLCGSNGRFLSSENGGQNMRCNRTNIGAWERFTVEVVGTNPLRLHLVASNGRYVTVNSNNTLRANGTSPQDAALFTSGASNGQHTLAIRGSFLSSENGNRTVRANRNSVGRWERWDISAQ